MKANKCYGAKIMESDHSCVWNGTVVAPNPEEARKLIVEFKRKNGLRGRSFVMLHNPVISKRKKPRVYQSMLKT